MKSSAPLLLSIIAAIIKPAFAEATNAVPWPPKLTGQAYTDAMASIQKAADDCTIAQNAGTIPRTTCCGWTDVQWTPDTCTGSDNTCVGGVTFDQSIQSSSDSYCGSSAVPGNDWVAIPAALAQYTKTGNAASPCGASCLCGETIHIISSTGEAIPAMIAEKAGAGVYSNGGANGLDLSANLFKEVTGYATSVGGTWKAEWYLDPAALKKCGL